MKVAILLALSCEAAAWKACLRVANIRPAINVARAASTLMLAADGEPPPPLPTGPDGEIETQGEGSTNYPWYYPDKKKTAWKPGDEAGMSNFLAAFNQGKDFNKNLKESRGEQTGIDASTIAFSVFLGLVFVYAVQVALSLAVF